MENNLKIITTEDGSHSLYREDLKETYHSFHGAKGESMHVFIEAGLQYAHTPGTSHLRIFEVGLGTGLNAFLASGYAFQNNIKVEFFSLEPYPVSKTMYKQLNYGQGPVEKKLLLDIHEAEWEYPISINEQFTLHKSTTRLEDMNTIGHSEYFDVIFFDAFAPSKQAALWGIDNLRKCADLLRTGGVLTTYCAQGQFKRDLRDAGFDVQTLRGAMGKKEMVRGVKKG